MARFHTLFSLGSVVLGALAGCDFIEHGGGADAGESRPVPATHFADFTSWTTPVSAEVGSSGWFVATAAGFSDTGDWSTFDIDGDRRPDLVVTSPVGSRQFGYPTAPIWQVALGTP